MATAEDRALLPMYRMDELPATEPPGESISQSSSMEEFTDQTSEDLKPVWETFNRMAHDHNTNMVKALGANLDAMLLFSALFSGVNSAILQISVPTLSPDPSDQTNQMLRLLILSMNGTHISTDDLAYQPPLPSRAILQYNQLFAASLTCSLLAAFGSVLGKQWLIYYDNSASTVATENRLRLQKQIFGAERWSLRSFVEVGVPFLLQVALFLFLIGLVIFFNSLNSDIGTVNLWISGSGLIIFAVVTLMGIWDPTCPFQTPLTSSVLSWVFRILMFYTFFAFATITANFLVLLWLCTLPFAIIVNLFTKKQTFQGLCLTYISHSRRTYRFMRDGAGAVDQGIRNFATSLRRKISTPSLNARTVVWILDNAPNREVIREVASSLSSVQDRTFFRTLFRHGNVPKHFWQAFNRSLSDAPPYCDPVIARAMVHLGIHIAFLGGSIYPSWYRQAESVLQRWYMEDQVEIRKSLSGTGFFDPAVGATWVAGAIKLSLYRVLYYRLRPGINRKAQRRSSKMPLKDDQAFINMLTNLSGALTPTSPPITVSLIAWGLARVQRRARERSEATGMLLLMEAEDQASLLNSYSNVAPFLTNMSDALDAYGQWPALRKEHSALLLEVYIGIMTATQAYISDLILEPLETQKEVTRFAQSCSRLLTPFVESPPNPNPGCAERSSIVLEQVVHDIPSELRLAISGVLSALGNRLKEGGSQLAPLLPLVAPSIKPPSGEPLKDISFGTQTSLQPLIDGLNIAATDIGRLPVESSVRWKQRDATWDLLDMTGQILLDGPPAPATADTLRQMADLQSRAVELIEVIADKLAAESSFFSGRWTSDSILHLLTRYGQALLQRHPRLPISVGLVALMRRYTIALEAPHVVGATADDIRSGFLRTWAEVLKVTDGYLFSEKEPSLSPTY